MRRGRVPAFLLLSAIATSCAYRATTPLKTYDLEQGYRFEKLPRDAASVPDASKNSDELFVILAFSGGGTRAAALSYGVLRQLHEVRFGWDPEAKAPCDPSAAGCSGPVRSLLDEVDVISSVSGGSFTSAYYALHGTEMFDPKSRFQTAFLYHPVQGDLFTHAIFRPNNWNRLLSRVEIAAQMYSDRIFSGATFKDLMSRPRPYVVINAADMSTGARFEFTQEQFDLLCADLTDVPVARAVAASSAFPGLLNSMTIDSHNGKGCGYYGPGSTRAEKKAAGAEFDLDFDWVDLALRDQFSNYARYRKARQLLDYRRPERQHLHLLDGGISDNLGLRSVLQSLSSSDRPAHRRTEQATPILGGWSVLDMFGQDPKKVKTIVVITVNAKTNRENDWDTKSSGPSTFSVLGVSRGVPMSGFTYETLELLREFGLEARYNRPGRPRLFAAEVAFENLPETTPAERGEKAFFFNMPTSFELSRYEVDCLADRGAALLRSSQSFGEVASTSFAAFVSKELRGRMSTPDMPHPAACDAETGKRAIVRHHYVDIGAQVGATLGRGDVEGRRSFGITGRARRPDGLGAIVGVGRQSFTIREAIGGLTIPLGDLNLWTFTGSAGYSVHTGGLETTLGVGGGYGVGGFELDDDAQDAFARGGAFGPETHLVHTWLVTPNLSFWYEMNNTWAATASVSYTYTRPMLRIDFDQGVRERRLSIGATRIGVGIARRVF